MSEFGHFSVIGSTPSIAFPGARRGSTPSMKNLALVAMPWLRQRLADHLEDRDRRATLMVASPPADDEGD